jgi:pimeloyl-ACP methyl ester carboxylesterase
MRSINVDMAPHREMRPDSELNDVDPSKVRFPTLIIHGALDPRATAAKDMKLLSRLGTQDRLLVVPSADHAVHLEDPQTAWLDPMTSISIDNAPSDHAHARSNEHIHR